VKLNHNHVVYVRRSRGYAPYAVRLPFEVKPTLAVGGEFKNTFCLTRDGYAFLSQNIGDLENVETQESFRHGIQHLSDIFHVEPEIVAHDLHPDYFTTQYAQLSMTNVQSIGVQHHHAHIASCMADHGLENKRLIGLSFDGSGYGTDGAIWGGEILLASYADFERFAHLEYLPLPVGDTALRSPWRLAVAYAHALGIDIDNLPFLQNIDRHALRVVRAQVSKPSDLPLASSMGCFFEAVASLIGIRNEVTYEAQAAIEMEVLSKPFVSTAESYPCAVDETENGMTIRLKEICSSIVQDVRANESVGMIGARFHRTIADLSVDVCKRARAKTGLNEVALSGGVWQNQVLLSLVRKGLKREEFVVYFHKQVPTNDGGLALGQAVVANFQASNYEENGEYEGNLLRH
jgi:hydrogenase maturation protein HypF